MLKFGFELEGFYRNAEGVIAPPPPTLPTDGFPGLVEARTFGGAEIERAAMALAKDLVQPSFNVVDFTVCEHKFTGRDLQVIRARTNIKEAVVINNIYGYSPRLLNNRTLASFQINISDSDPVNYIDKDNRPQTVYRQNLLDIPEIVRNLDEEFRQEIKDSKRQPGWYAIKDGKSRLEYRSLPNFVFPMTHNIKDVMSLVARINRCVRMLC